MIKWLWSNQTFLYWKKKEIIVQSINKIYSKKTFWTRTINSNENKKKQQYSDQTHRFISNSHSYSRWVRDNRRIAIISKIDRTILRAKKNVPEEKKKSSAITYFFLFNHHRLTSTILQSRHVPCVRRSILVRVDRWTPITSATRMENNLHSINKMHETKRKKKYIPKRHINRVKIV